MDYNKIQKILSGLVLFSLLFSITFRIPFFSFFENVFAQKTNFYNLVSILVQEDIYPWVKANINRYAKDIQWVLENTRVVILPIPAWASAFKIASMNESLYYDGYKWLTNVKFDSKLIWTVLVWDFPLPVVYDNWKTAKTIVPYVDFKDKQYIYDNKTKKYEKNNSNYDGFKAEIWHWVITPNTWTKVSDISAINNYFDKNHDYYTGQWKFKTTDWIINWKGDIPSNYKPYVFYYDQFREEKSISFQSYKWYQALLANLEDITYNRFSKQLANRVKNFVLGDSKKQALDLINNLPSYVNTGALQWDLWPNLTKSSDIQTMPITRKTIKKFIEIFNSASFWDFKKNVYNSWRYNGLWSQVNVDFTPSFISALDDISSQIIKDANNNLEKQIDDLVKNWLSRKIAIPESIIFWNSTTKTWKINTCGLTYTNILYWNNNVNTASNCSIYRWSIKNSWTLVEANRWININNIKPDVDASMFAKTQGYWGWNSPLNLDKSQIWNWVFKLINNNLNTSIVPLFDIVWSSNINDSLKTPSPLNCLNNNFILTKKSKKNKNSCKTSLQLPVSWLVAKGWTTASINTIWPDYTWKFETFYKNNPETNGWISPICNDKITYSPSVNNFSILKSKYVTKNNKCKISSTDTYNFKFIPSFVTHKSPTYDELSKEIGSLITPNLPIDKDRYIDYIDAKWNYKKINYPYLFRIKNSSGIKLDIANIGISLKKALDKKSALINAIINSSNPSTLSWKDLTLYNLLKSWAYPAGNINLYNNIKNKASVQMKSYGETKSINYYDTLVFALYWKELNSIWAKYKFIFENYLSDQFGSNSFWFNLPRNKKSYEIAYIWAPWTAKDMFVKVDPAGKGVNPYASIISKNIDLSSKLLWLNIWWWIDSQGNNSGFKCAPPEWVSIINWLPAVVCWLKDIVPPKVSLSASSCWVSDLSWVGWSFISNNKGQACNKDLNKNGIYDCLETKLTNGSIDLSSRSSKYYYNGFWKISAQIKDINGDNFTIDNTTKIKFVLQKVEAKSNLNKAISNINKKIIFDRNNYTDGSRTLANDYVFFRDWDVGVNSGLAISSFTTKWKDANLYFKAFIDIKDKNGKVQISIKSQDLLVKVRWERLFITSSTVKWWVLSTNDSSVKVSNNTNIYLSNSNKFNISNNISLLSNNSLSKNKLLLELSNLSKWGISVPLSYPITVSLFSGNKQINTRLLQKIDLNNFVSLYNLQNTWIYKIEIIDNIGQKITKTIDILPEVPSKIKLNLWSTVIKTWWNIITNLVSVVDKYGNAVSWKLYTFDIKLNWKWLIFSNSDKTVASLQTYEWYRAFVIKSTNNVWITSVNIDLKDSTWNIVLSTTQKIRVVDSVKLNISYPNIVKVWWWEYEINVEMRNAVWNVMTDFNSRIYSVINNSYLTLKSPFVNIVAWKATILFNTKTLATKNANIEFQVEGINNIFNKTIKILPDLPMKVDIALSKDKLEARDNINNQDRTILKVELKDRYNNLVFIDNSTNVFLETVGNNTTVSNSRITWWVWSFSLIWWINPWITYFKVNVTPKLENNSFVTTWKSPITIKWVSSNAWKYETFYFWNKNKVFGKNYNSIYTTLLWAPYWDITKSWYLAWWLLFDRNNRALAVTSLINNPYRVDDVLSIKNAWNINKLYSSSNLSQDISIKTSFKNNKIFLDLYNNALNKHIWEAYYNFSNNTLLNSCSGSWWNLDNCNISTAKSSIILKSIDSNYISYKSWWNIIFESLDKTSKVQIDKLWKVQKTWNISLEIDKTNNKNYLILNIKNNQKIVWKIWFNFVWSKIKITRDTTILNNLLKLNNYIIIYIPSSSYASRKLFTSINATNIYYIDPFSSSYTLNSFSRNNISWYENFIKKEWIGWSKWNKTLLSFAAGKSVWEATKDYQSFSLINLWDPVLFLNKIKKKFTTNNNTKKFDSTIWKLLTKDKNIFWYRIFDYDNNNKDDILVIKQDGYLKLFENTSSRQRFSNEWSLVYAADLWNKDLIKTGDFTWDWYDDIFFINNKWKPFIFNNNIKNFTRIDLSKNFNIDSRIVSVEKFDMDNDGKTDIITLDENGDIIIFYWWWSFNKPFFTKKLIDSWNGIKLSSKVRNLGTLLYYDGLPQKLPWNNINTSWVIGNTTINKLLFENITYPLTWTGKLLFLKWEYSSVSKLDIKKRMFDRNAWTLKSWDVIDAEIVITNTGLNTLKNIKILDNIPKIFKFNISSVKIEWTNTWKISPWLWTYDLLLDNIDLWPNKTIKIKYTLTTYPLKYWVFSVWYFEKGEAGDDNFWDIFLKEKKQNCSKAEVILRSSGARSYIKWKKVPTCDANKIALPPTIVDANNNWIPDATENLLKAQSNINLSLKNGSTANPSDLQKITNFGNQNKAQFLWVPWNNTSILDNLGKINENTDLYLNDIKKVEDWFSCGFWSQWCIASPMNWAPLAPGSDPTLFGKPIWDWLKIDEWIPIFSAMTWKNFGSAWCLPVFYPLSANSVWCSWNWAWWSLWTWNPTNFFRLFITPTLTWWVWTAACFGWPASVAWSTPPQWVYPIASWWNCVVAAAPLLSCKSDWSSWDVRSLWVISSGWPSGGQFWVINGTCNKSKAPPSAKNLGLNPQFVKGYLNILTSGTLNLTTISWLKNTFKNSLNSTWLNRTVQFTLPNPPLISWFAWDLNKEFVADIDFSSIWNWEFKDVVKIKQSRISSFPDFLMDWVTRQIEEIVVKLTDFPTLFVILPDFSSIFDLKSKVNQSLTNIKWMKPSWIKETYTFLSSLPIINMEVEPVNISIPFIDSVELNKFISKWKNTKKQWIAERDDKQNSWSLWKTCPAWDQACIDDKQNKLDIIAWTNKLINSLEKNIGILNWYKKFPKELNRLITKKQSYLEQVLCQVESISQMTTGWITKNWKRFKTWVELYVLIKAILKSWQLLIDVFVDYSAECQECKNTRWNLQKSIWKKVSMATPQIPVIQFPKWPDVILDLHNIRMWIKIVLPEFNFTNRPILLPTLPRLRLPDIPDLSLSFTLPSLPVLPELNIWELPDLPSIPSITLPNLPPPPTLPRIFSSIEWVVNIIKLITKMMCILKTSPFVPEWRAGDQIAFLTDRNGYLKTDFVDKSAPQFSYSSVDAIRVTTFVNLETQTNFIIDLARAVLEPVNNFSNDITRIFNLVLPDLDFSNTAPSSVNVSPNTNIQWFKMNKTKQISLLSLVLSKQIVKVQNYISDNRNIKVSNKDFLSLVNESLSSNIITSDPRLDKLRGVWKETQNMTYSKEKKLTTELLKNNRDKFDEFKNIINEEKLINKKLKENINKLGKEKFINKVVSISDIKQDIYKKRMKKYNDKVVSSILDIRNSWNKGKEELKPYKTEIISRVSSWIKEFDDKWLYTGKNDLRLLSQASTSIEPKITNSKPTPLLSAIQATSSTANSSNICIASNNNKYKYKYKWIYVVEWSYSYRLFDYTDELYWDENTTTFNLDSDSDSDLIYSVWDEIFIKENLSINPVRNYLTLPPLYLSSNNNKFLNWNSFIEAVNNGLEVNVSDKIINLGFSNNKWWDINNYRLEYYTIIDKLNNLLVASYVPTNIRKNIIDAFAWKDEVTKISETKDYILSDNLWYIRNIWNMSSWVTLQTKEFLDIKKDLLAWRVVQLSSNTKLYAWNTNFTITYKGISNTEKTKFVWAFKNIEFKENVKIIKITWSAYSVWWDTTLTWSMINTYRWLPVLTWMKLDIPLSNTFNTTNNFEVKYYDNSSALIDFNKIKKYEVFDLWSKTNDYLIRLKTINDYFYWKIFEFKNNIFGTSWKKILLSPQKEADRLAPELLSSKTIRIPVYQTKKIDFTSMIYENAWIKNIKDIYIDFDLNVDSDLDWNTKNDRDTKNIQINKTPTSINITFWPYTKLFSKKIWITIIDNNDNIWYKELPFTVYSPVPEINSYSWATISWLLNENLTNEPVGLYRYRWWIISKISWKGWTNKALTSSWLYNLNTSQTASWLELKYNNNIVANINETTWLINLIDPSLTIKVLASNSVLNKWIYPKIIINKWLQELYYENINIWNNADFKVVNSFAGIQKVWIYLKFTNKLKYNYYKIPSAAKYSPWVIGIYRNTSLTKQALFSVYPDGRISSINLNDFILEYSTFNNYVVIKLIDKIFNREVAQIMYRANASYIIK